jgi:hypothetical protein
MGAGCHSRNLLQQSANSGIHCCVQRSGGAVTWLLEANAGIAQLVEQLICNQQVVGSNPTAGSLVNRELSSNSRRSAWTLLAFQAVICAQMKYHKNGYKSAWAVKNTGFD